jgi:hypothetical protein
VSHLPPGIEGVHQEWHQLLQLNRQTSGASDFSNKKPTHVVGIGCNRFNCTETTLLRLPTSFAVKKLYRLGETLPKKKKKDEIHYGTPRSVIHHSLHIT